MKRRKFLKVSAPVAISPLLINGLPVHSFATPNMLNLLSCEEVSERVLVLIQLKGGNDGVNTIVPIDQYGIYKSLRPNIALPETGTGAYINLDNTLPVQEQVGLHPSMTAVKTLYEQGKVNIIQGVSYENHNRSHFKSTDLWLTGGDGTPANFNLGTGWMGRYLDYTFPGLAGNPSPLMPDPLGIQLGDSKPSVGFHTAAEHAAGINLSGQNLSGYYNVVSELGGAPLNMLPEGEYGEELQFIMNIENSVSNYAQRITSVFNSGTNYAAYPNTDLANQLKTVARLISGGCMTKIYLVNISGFDTHVNQITNGSPHLGTHATLLERIAEAVLAFQTDLIAIGVEQKVMTATFSEFGRKPIENGNIGTDHGGIAPMLLFGSGVEPGITGTNVDLNNLNGDQLQNAQFDYRQVFTTLLQDWLGTGDDGLEATLFGAFVGNKLPLVNATAIVDPDCYLLTPLPVELQRFTATPLGDQQVLLEWLTNSEERNAYFVVERSAEGRQFEPILQVDSLGDSNSLAKYNEVDEAPLKGHSYYRLKQVDTDGQFTYSEIVSVYIKDDKISSYKLYPNPAIYDVNVVMTATESFSANIEVLSASGISLISRAINMKNGFNKVNIDVSRLARGNYIVRLDATNRQLSETLPLVVQN